jgi:hypothetical protein
MCALIFSTKIFYNTSHSKKNWGRYDEKFILTFMQNFRNSRLILIKLEFSWQILENFQISNFKKIRQVETEFLHADRQRDMAKLIVTFRKFVNETKNVGQILEERCNCLVIV